MKGSPDLMSARQGENRAEPKLLNHLIGLEEKRELNLRVYR